MTTIILIDANVHEQMELRNPASDISDPTAILQNIGDLNKILPSNTENRQQSNSLYNQSAVANENNSKAASEGKSSSASISKVNYNNQRPRTNLQSSKVL